MKYLFLFLTCFFASILYADNTPCSLADSIHRALPRLQGAEREEAYLQELAARYEESTLRGNMDTVLASLEPYLAEAIRQGNVKEEQYARMEKVYCYYNYLAYDLLYDEIEQQMEYFSQKAWWEEYYLCTNLQVEALIFADKPVSALREADRRYTEAKLSKDPFAIGMTAYGLFCCYHYSGHNQEAARIYKEIANNEEQIPLTQRINYYVAYSTVLRALKRFDELLQLAIHFEAVVDQYDEDNRRKGYVPNSTVFRFYAYCSYADAYTGTGQYEQAETYFRKASALSRDTRGSRIPLLILHAHILSGQGHYAEALAQIDSVLNDPSESESDAIQVYHRSMKADILHHARRFQESSTLYQDVLERTDSLYNRDVEIQLSDLRTIYKLDQYKMETALRKQQLLFALIGCTLLALVLLIIVRNYRLIRRKNRTLCEQIEQQAIRLKQENEARQTTQALRIAETEQPIAPNKQPTNENELFTRFTQLLADEKLHLTSEINRDMLVDRLGTNKNKLAEAIATATGRTLTEHITELRLREALLLMESQPDLSLAQIAEQTGFGVYSSFYRAFSKQYGVKPTEYRNYRKG